jgi:hypothetical protein
MHFNADQLILPFAEKEYVNVGRTARILGVGITTVYRLARLQDKTGHTLLTLVEYRPQARKRILYSSIVRFCDSLRARFGIEDRRPKLDHPMFRHRDEDLLPFPLSDTIGSIEALSALGYEDIRPLVCLIEEGRFDAYQFLRESPWRISRSSFKTFLAATRDREVATKRNFTTTSHP